MSDFLDSHDPFPQVDSSHGPSRDVLVVYLRQLRDSFKEISGDLKSHKKETSEALESIRLQLAVIPKGCSRSDQCESVFRQINELQIDKARRQGALWMSKAWMVILSSTIGAASAIAATWFMFFPHGKP